jgi:hypothetical protein
VDSERFQGRDPSTLPSRVHRLSSQGWWSPGHPPQSSLGTGQISWPGSLRTFQAPRTWLGGASFPSAPNPAAGESVKGRSTPPAASPSHFSLPSLRSSASSEEPREIPSKEGPLPGLPAMATRAPGSPSSLRARSTAFPAKPKQCWRRRDSERALHDQPIARPRLPDRLADWPKPRHKAACGEGGGNWWEEGSGKKESS